MELLLTNRILLAIKAFCSNDINSFVNIVKEMTDNFTFVKENSELLGLNKVLKSILEGLTGITFDKILANYESGNLKNECENECESKIENECELEYKKEDMSIEDIATNDTREEVNKIIKFLNYDKRTKN